MKKLLLLASTALAVALTFGWLALMAAPSADRPPGVAEEDWLAISDSLGLVVGPYKGAALDLGGVPRTRVGGRLMAKVEGRWVMVALADTEGTLRILPAR